MLFLHLLKIILKPKWHILKWCIFFINLFYFWLRWVFVAARGLLTAVASLVAEHGL